MRISRIYTTAALNSNLIVALDEKASHHLGKVLRHKVGDALVLFNGDGQQYAAEICAIDKRQVTVAVGVASSPVTESPLQIHLGIAISKGDRMDWVLQKSTELGVSEITPLSAERTEFKLKGERLDKKISHWQQIIISACEQCGRNTLPRLHPPASTSAWCKSTAADKKLVLHHRSSGALDPAQSIHSVALMIGPEGGLSAEEIQLAETEGFEPLTLGPRVLRTETAPLAAIAVLQSIWGDFR